MQNLELKELTLEELDGAAPQADEEITIQNQRYWIVEVRQPVVKPPSKWRRKPANQMPPKYRLLVRKLD